MIFRAAARAARSALRQLPRNLLNDGVLKRAEALGNGLGRRVQPLGRKGVSHSISACASVVRLSMRGSAALAVCSSSSDDNAKASDDVEQRRKTHEERKAEWDAAQAAKIRSYAVYLYLTILYPLPLVFIYRDAA